VTNVVAFERPDPVKSAGAKRNRWLVACAMFPPLRDSAIQLRLAILLWDYHNSKMGLAFPSRQTLADRLGIDPTNVSRALRRLQELGMITVIKARDMDEDVLSQTPRRDRRAHLYQLNFDWSEQMLTGCE
jgi:hypothetical protein